MISMKITVKNIGSKGLELDEQIDPVELGLKNDDFQCLSTIDVKARVERLGDTVLAKTEAQGTFSFICARCLEPVQKQVKEDSIFDYKLEKTTQVIELNEDIRQELILAFPMVVVCKEDCKGLCLGCGVNLNKEQCRCHKDTTTQGHKAL